MRVRHVHGPVNRISRNRTPIPFFLQLPAIWEPYRDLTTIVNIQRRLVQCRSALTSPNGIARSVADIAFGWGFNSLATFYRAFEREFGLPPTALRPAHSD
jgi:AraC-like DNA-binding protein